MSSLFIQKTWQENLPLFTKIISQQRIGLLTDVDGTISPIVDQPSAAVVTPDNRRLLGELADRLTVVGAVSGRAAADIQSRVGLHKLVYIGNHGFERASANGIEPLIDLTPYQQPLQRARAQIEAICPDGAWVEDKGATLTVHYRNTADPARAAGELRPHIESLAADLGLRLFDGRMVFELRPPADCNKGTALIQLAQEYALDAMIYLGDDVTDVDGFVALQRLQREAELVTAAVGVWSADMPTAVGESTDCLVDGVAGVSELLAWLLNAINASST